MIAFALVTAGGADNFPPRGPVKVSISALARQFGVSRVHVRTLLRDAASAGYIVWPDGIDAKVIVLPPLQDAVETFFASAFLYMRARRLRGGRGGTANCAHADDLRGQQMSRKIDAGGGLKWGPA